MTDGGAIRARGTGARVTVRVQPRASRNDIAVAADGSVRVKVTAPPVDGAANDAVVALLAERLAISRQAVQLVHGGGARQKIVDIAGISAAEVRRRLLGAKEA